MFAVMSYIAKGIITSFAGAIADIPAGWVLCNGSNGTPDLRDNFVVGAGTSYAVEQTGGSTEHSHAVNQNGHYHNVGSGNNIAAGSGYNDATGQTDPAITCSVGIVLPPYYALAYIMKL